MKSTASSINRKTSLFIVFLLFCIGAISLLVAFIIVNCRSFTAPIISPPRFVAEFFSPNERNFSLKCISDIEYNRMDQYQIVSFTVYSDFNGISNEGFVRTLIYGGKNPNLLFCPRIAINSSQVVTFMASRSPVIQRHESCWTSLLCEYKITEFDQDIIIITSDQKIWPVVPLKPRNLVEKILFIGDSGCNPAEQKCSDSMEWPIKTIATEVASVKDIDLLVLLGDFRYYFPVPCENNCTDNLSFWLAEFILPYYDVLQRIPLVPVRGNHERCTKKSSSAGIGWFYLMASSAFNETPTCDDPNTVSYTYTEPYRIILGNDTFVIVDSSDSSDYPAQLEEKYQKSLLGIQKYCKNSIHNCFLIQHHPVFGIKGDNLADDIINRTFWNVYRNLTENVVKIIISGHIHLHQRVIMNDNNNITDNIGVINMKKPHQLSIGNGGAAMNHMRFPANYLVTIDNTSYSVFSHRAFGFDIWSKDSKSNPFGYQMFSHFLTFINGSSKPIWSQEEYKFPSH